MKTKEQRYYHTNILKPYVCKVCSLIRSHEYPKCRIGCNKYNKWKYYDTNKDWSQWESKAWKGENND